MGLTDRAVLEAELKPEAGATARAPSAIFAWSPQYYSTTVVVSLQSQDHKDVGASMHTITTPIEKRT